MLDSSGSVGVDNFQRMKDFMADILEDIDVGTCDYRIGVAKYGSNAMVQFHLNRYNNNLDIISAVEDIQFTFGYTDTAGALQYARQTMFIESNGDRKNVRDILIVFTDGLNNLNVHNVLGEVRKATKKGMHIIPVGINVDNKNEVTAMATGGTEGTFFAEAFHGLHGIRHKLVAYILEGI